MQVKKQQLELDMEQRTEGFPGGTSGKEPAYQCRRCKRRCWEDPLENEMATHSSILV